MILFNGDSRNFNRTCGNLSYRQLLGANGIQVKGKIDKRYLLLPIDRSQSLVEK